MKYFLVLVLISIIVNATESLEAAPICQTANSDSDGDGWGWENNQSCIVTGATPSENQSNESNPFSASTDCIDDDGDGWGWNGSQSCKIQSENTQVPTQNPIDSSVDNSDPIASSECIDTDGDGWGWDGSQSCQINVENTQNNQQPVDTNPVIDEVSPSVNPASQGECTPLPAGETRVSSSFPVRSNGNSFYSNVGPQRVGPGRQYDGPGLRFGDFLLTNNAWNGHVSSHNWYQEILLVNRGGSYAAGIDYDWGDEYSLNYGREWEVKSYPELIFGIKSSTESSGTCEQTGLPARYVNLPNFDINFAYTATQTNQRVGTNGPNSYDLLTLTGGDRNIALESFFHSNCNISRGQNGPNNVEFEVMVWLDRGPERLPSGQAPREIYTDSQGRTYDVYTKSNDRKYIAFVAKTKVSEGTINWNEFINYARANDSRLGLVSFQDNWCLANILFGSEIWWGAGSIRFNNYSITRRY